MNKGQILVVDDDADVRQLLDVCLRAGGFAVSFATDGLSCLMQAQSLRPDLVILDLGLPAGDGLTALRRLRASSKLANIPVIVFSARDEERWGSAALGAGANLYLRKPVRSEKLLAAVEELLLLRPKGQPVPLPPTSPQKRVQAGSPTLVPAGAGEHARQGTLSCPHCGESLATVNVFLDPAPTHASRGETPAA